MLSAQRAAAREFLAATLANGAVPALQVVAHAQAAGIAERTLQRARKDIGVQAVKAAFGGAWIWRFAPKEASPTKTAPATPASVEANGHRGHLTEGQITRVWHHPAALAAIEAYWQRVCPAVPPCLAWTFAREAGARYPGNLADQACWCLTAAIREAVGADAATVATNGTHGA
jgi:hypothetical protein